MPDAVRHERYLSTQNKTHEVRLMNVINRRTLMKDFTTGSIPKQLLAFAVPLLLGNFLQTFIEVMNMFWVGRILGHEAIAAVATSLPILFLLISVLIGLSIAANIIVAQAYGAKNIKYMEKTFANSLIMSVALCVVVSAGGIIFSDQLLTLINCPLAIKAQASSYFKVVLIGLSFMFIYNWYSGIQRGLGDAKTPLYILMLNAALNLCLVPLFIKYFGLNGAAFANIISGIISTVAGYFYASARNPFFNVREWDFSLDLSIIKKLFGIGIPASLQMIIISIAGFAIMNIVNGYGALVTAAAGIGQQCDQLAFLPAMSIGLAVTSMAGQNLSAGKMDRVKQVLKYGLLLSLSISIIFTLFIYLFPHQIASVFTRDESAALIIPHVVGYLGITCFSYIAFAMVFTIMGVVRGAGDTVGILVLSFISAVLFRIPLAWYLSSKTTLGENGIWLAILITSYITALLNFGYYKLGRWKKIKLLHGREQAKVMVEEEKEFGCRE